MAKVGVSMFPQTIKSLRKERELTQKEVAHALGITRPAYTAYEMGKRKPEYETLMSLARFFHVTTDFLLGYSETNSPAYQLVTDNQLTIAAQIDEHVTDQQMKDILRYIDLIKLENKYTGSK